MRHAEPLEAVHRADEVHQRIEGTDLVQRDVIRRHAVHAGLGVGEQPERPARTLLHRAGEPGRLDDAEELTDVSVRVVTVRVQVHEMPRVGRL